MIWNTGMALSIIASGAAGFAICTASVRARRWSRHSGRVHLEGFWDAPAGTTSRLLGLMFASFVVGLGLIVAARVV